MVRRAGSNGVPLPVQEHVAVGAALAAAPSRAAAAAWLAAALGRCSATAALLAMVGVSRRLGKRLYDRDPLATPASNP